MKARRAAWVLPWAALGCLPQSDDLSAYSAEWSPVPSAGGAGPSSDAGAGGAAVPFETGGAAGVSQAAAGSDGVVGGGSLPLGGGGTSALGQAGEGNVMGADGGGTSALGQAGEGNVMGADGGAPGADAGVSTGGGGAPSEEPPPCPDGLLGPGGSPCYRVVTSGASWQGARDDCAAWQGALIKVETPEEDAFLDGIVDVAIWLGGSDTVFENVFLWTDGTPITYGNWGPNQPDLFPGQDCVEKRDALSDRQWFDQPCFNARAFVCEKPVPP